MSQRFYLSIIAPLTALVLAIFCWQAVVWLTGVSPIVMPAPTSVMMALKKEAPKLLNAAMRTSTAAILGLFASTILGVICAFGFSQSRLIRTTFYPFAILLQTVPIIAVAPIVVISFGRGFLSVALISMIISIFPVITSTTTGLLQVEASLLELFRLNKATWWQELWKLRLPSSLPYMISGIRIAGGAAIVGAIVGEFFVGSGQPGLGAMIQKKSQGMNMDELYATVFVATLLGVVFFSVVTLIGERTLKTHFATSLSGSPGK
ncbi:MAG: ABC transporter permease [Fuerstiella sp.]